jgi:hypothetical protein
MSITSSLQRLHISGKLFSVNMKKPSCLMAMCGFLWLTGAAQNACAATQLFGTDFESATLASKFGLNVPTTNTIQSSVVHAGTKALFYNPSSGSNSGGLAASIPVGTTVYAKWWWWVPSTIVSGAGRHGWRFGLRQADNFLAHAQVDTVMGSGGGFGVDIFQSDDGIDSGTRFHNLFTLPTNQWFQFEVLCTLNTRGTSNGVMTFWINGVQRFTASNVLFRGPSSAMNGYDTFLLTTNFDGAGSESYWYMDDVQVWDGLQQTGGSPPPPPILRVQ